MNTLPNIGEKITIVGDHSHAGQRGEVYSHERYDGKKAFLVSLDTGQRVGVSDGWQWTYDTEVGVDKKPTRNARPTAQV